MKASRKIERRLDSRRVDFDKGATSPDDGYNKPAGFKYIADYIEKNL